MSANAAAMPSVRWTSAPAARATSTARAGAVRGITTVAATPRASAITATAMPWLPPLTASTPAARSGVVQDEQLRRRATRLERPGTLQQLQLGGDGHAEQLGQARAGHGGRVDHMAGDPVGGRLDVR